MMVAEKEAKNQTMIEMIIKSYSIQISTELEIQIIGNAIIAVLEEMSTL